VVLAANVMAMLVQYLSAKLGVVTGRNLPEVCRDTFSRPTVVLMWLQAEVMAMACDMGEFIGGAIALNLLFGTPLFVSAILTGAAAFAILAVRERGYRAFELTIGAMLGVILLAFLYDSLKVGGSAPQIARGFIPAFSNSGSVVLAVGILGATIMPHVIYLHSALVNDRIPAQNDGEKRQLLRFQKLDVGIALGIAGVVNLAMLAVAAAAFHHPGMNVQTIGAEHAGFAHSISKGAALAFALGLLASGLAASSVGTQAGQVVMQGFVQRRIPIYLRRLLTMAPALIVIGIGLDPTKSLIISQVVLSFGIPMALIPLVLLTGRKNVMGDFANRAATATTAWIVAAVVSALNVFLIVQIF
jgi:manganese transport protein